MKSLFFIALILVCIKAGSQTIQELTPELLPAIDFSNKIKDSITRTAAIYKSANEKRKNNLPLTKKEAAVIKEIENSDDITLDMFLENGFYYYVGPGYGCCYEENGGPDSIWATSELDDNYLVDKIYDGSLDFAWVEGKKDDGIGESISFKMIDNAWPLEKIIIYNGFQKDPSLWKKNNRVKQLMLYIDGKPVAKLNLEDVTNGQEFDVVKWFPQRKEPYIVRFEILKTYRGTTYNDTAISEIDFDGPVSH
jgi:hypothetical protein